MQRSASLLRASAIVASSLLLSCSAGKKGQPAAPTPAPAVAAIALTAPASTVAIGATTQLAAVATDSGGQPVAARFTWDVSDPAVASVDAGGMLVSLGPGTATIRAAVGTVRSNPVAVTAAPLAGVATVTLSPATVSLLVNQPAQLAVEALDGSGVPIPLAIRQIAWQSSDASIALAAGGVAFGRSPGTATIVASVGGVQSAPITVSVADLTQQQGVTAATSEGLIAQALAAGTITDEQALVYRVLADFGSPDLPAEYQGNVFAAGLDGSSRLAVVSRWATLSPAAQAQLHPYLTPPVYAGSWGDPAAVPLAAHASAPSAQPAIRTALPTCVGELQSVPPGWGLKTTAHFNVWYQTVVEPGHIVGYYTAEESELAAANLASVAEEIWAAETGYMGRSPLSDAGRPCNGGDGAVDLYAVRLRWSRGGETVAYPDACAGTPAWTWIAPDFAVDPQAARDALAHEFMHQIQFAYSRAAACELYDWLDEAGANWAIDLVYHADNFEQSSAWSYFCKDSWYPIEAFNPKDFFTGTEHGYEDYVFLQYLANAVAPSAPRQIFDFAQGEKPVDAIASAVNTVGNLDDVWMNFSAAAWNDAGSGGILHQLHDSDPPLPSGMHACFHPAANMSAGYVRDVPVTLRSPPDYPLDLAAEGAFDVQLITPGGTCCTVMQGIAHMSMDYVDLPFTDPTVRSIVYQNKPAALVAAYPHLRIQALRKVGGTWKGPDDWTHQPFETFCRDATDENLDELVVVYSNASTKDDIDLAPGNLGPAVAVSNAACWGFTGTTRVSSDLSIPGVQTGNELVTASVAFARDRSLVPPGVDTVGRDTYAPTGGTVTYSMSVTDAAGCTITILPTTATISPADGYIDLAYDLPGEVNDRSALAHGSTAVPVTETIACPTGTTTAQTTVFASWLTAPNGPLTLSSDGQQIAGSATLTDPSGSTQTYEWNLVAQPQ